MNPEIDLKSFQTGNRQSPGSPDAKLVSPPRRIFTRFLIPILLLTAFAGIFAYAARDAMLPVIEVEVVQPVFGGAREVVTSTTALRQQTSAPAPQPGNPQTSTAEPLFQAPGWVEPDPFTTLVSSLIAGTLSQVYVREGQSVPAGTVVAELDSTDAKIAVSKAEATLAVRKAELAAAQQNWDHPIAIQQTLKTAQAEKARLEAEKLKLQRQYEFQSKLANISRQLGKSGADSVLTAEKAVLEASVAEATVREIDAKILAQDAILQGAASTADLRIEDKSRLELAKAQVLEAEAALQEAGVALARCKVTAPTTATVMRLHKTPGAMVSADVPDGTQIVSMYDPQSLQVRAEVPLAEAGKIQIGLPAEIRVEAMPGKVFRGELTRIVHQADVQRNSLQVKVRILDPVPTLKPEMVARVQFLAGDPAVPAGPPGKAPQSPQPKTATPAADSPQDLFIPQKLISEDAEKETLLWLVGPDMKAMQKSVTLGAAVQGDLRQVTSGLQPSDKIIISDTSKLKPGSRVRIASTDRKKDTK